MSTFITDFIPEIGEKGDIVPPQTSRNSWSPIVTLKLNSPELFCHTNIQYPYNELNALYSIPKKWTILFSGILKD